MTFRVVLLLSFASAASIRAQAPVDFFRQNCTSCHTIGGGRLTGPDLKNVTQRKDRTWIVQFLQGPQAAIDRGDPYALKLQQEARGVVMPTIAGMTPQRATQLLDLIESESRLAESQFAGVQIGTRPFTTADIAAGWRIFRGEQRLAGGAPACISCHTLRGTGGLSGGRLAPDLTRVFERLQGRKNLAAWLSGPATPTMQSVFRNSSLRPGEIPPLVALFESEANAGGQDDSPAQLEFFLAGLGLAVAGLVALDSVWKRRFRAVRRPLVHNGRNGGNL